MAGGAGGVDPGVESLEQQGRDSAALTAANKAFRQQIKEDQATTAADNFAQENSGAMVQAASRVRIIG